MTSAAILYQNASATVFLVDIPTSIALAQDLSPTQQLGQQHLSPKPTTAIRPRKIKILLSSSPQEGPFSSTEPKSDKARARVFARIPESGRIYHESVIRPCVEAALVEIRRGTWHAEERDEWCFVRRVRDDPERSSRRELKTDLQEPHGGAARRHKRKRRSSPELLSTTTASARDVQDARPPIILSSMCDNLFDSLQELEEIVVKNPTSELAILKIPGTVSSSSGDAACEEETGLSDVAPSHKTIYIPPMSRFVLCTIPLSGTDSSSNLSTQSTPIPGLSRDNQFDLILLDPPWPNRSVCRSGHYQTQEYDAMSALTERMQMFLEIYLRKPRTLSLSKRVECSEDTPASLQKRNDCSSSSSSTSSVAAIWITNSEKSRKVAYNAISSAGLTLCEEWIWIKTTVSGEPIVALDGLWRKPYEILVIGRDLRGMEEGRQGNAFGDTDAETMTTTTTTTTNIIRRVIAGVPDIHSRKPNLKELFEQFFFREQTDTYDALEVFARNLTAGWCACGNDVLKFNSEEWWTDG